MKIAFLTDVAGVANAGEIKEVTDGYARHFLIPRKLGIPATAEVLKNLNRQLESRVKKEASREIELKRLAEELDGIEITLKTKVGTGEKLYGRITSSEIAGEIERTTGKTIDKRKIELIEPIKKLGHHEAFIKFHADLTAKVLINIEALEEK
jgi:large subunit ribosomal protein L9